MKLVHAVSYDWIAHPQSEVTWCDVWIKFREKPARKVVKYGPTLMGLAVLKSELYINEQCQAERPDLDFSEDIESNKKALAELANAEIYVEEPIRDVPDIYINKEYFTRKDADRMIDALLKKLGYSGAKVKWPRPPTSLVGCVTVNVGNS
jgi:hypothetical protein